MVMIDSLEIIEIIKDISKELDEEKNIVEFTENTNLIEIGIVDSLMMVELVLRIEEKYDISIDADDLIPENFISAMSIAKMVVNSKENNK